MRNARRSLQWGVCPTGRRRRLLHLSGPHGAGAALHSSHPRRRLIPQSTPPRKRAPRCRTRGTRRSSGRAGMSGQSAAGASHAGIGRRLRRPSATQPFLNSPDVMIAHARDEAPALSGVQDVPADLERTIHRCLAKSPNDRFQDVGSLEQALSQCSAADRWSQADAVRWWHEHDQTWRRTEDVH